VNKILATNAIDPHRMPYHLERRDPKFEAKMAKVYMS
jgi:hypothetical protein